MEEWKQKIIDRIYLFYPKNIIYGDPKYFESKEYIYYNKIKKTNTLSFEREKLYKELVAHFGSDKVDDFSLLMDTPSLVFKIYGPITDKRDIDWVLYISTLTNRYIVCKNINLVGSKKGWDTYILGTKSIGNDDKKVMNFVSNKIESILPDYEYLPSSFAKYKVSNIWTPTKEKGDVVVFDCLFTDNPW
ncbi:MAG: hypothetical protein NW226_22460 [Microscillaceae bacterium]|nr:hypothetical protein [Microscillaceae bacterium]